LSRPRPDSGTTTAERQRRQAHGRRSEWRAAALLLLKGYRILARNVVTPVGEIDLVAVRGRRLAFVEVKARPDAAGAEAAVGPEQSRRIRHAADLWLARRRRYHDHDLVFDIVWVLPRRLPRHLPDAL
jgi:putative endonuclease